MTYVSSCACPCRTVAHADRVDYSYWHFFLGVCVWGGEGIETRSPPHATHTRARAHTHAHTHTHTHTRTRASSERERAREKEGGGGGGYTRHGSSWLATNVTACTRHDNSWLATNVRTSLRAQLVHHVEQADAVPFEAAYRIYADGTILFDQTWPEGAENTGAKGATVLAAFPSLALKHVRVDHLPPHTHHAHTHTYTYTHTHPSVIRTHSHRHTIQTHTRARAIRPLSCNTACTHPICPSGRCPSRMFPWLVSACTL